MREHQCFTDVERKTLIEIANGTILESISLMGILDVFLWWYVLSNKLGNMHYIGVGVFTIATGWVAVREWNLRIKP